MAILGGTERLVSTHCLDLMTKVHAIFAAYYQAELVSEDIFLKWNAKISKKYVDKESALKVRQAAKPFFDWLQTAEDDEEEEK